MSCPARSATLRPGWMSCDPATIPSWTRSDGSWYGGKAGTANTGCFRDIGEGAVSVVVIELVATVSSDIDIFVAVIIVVANGDAHSVTDPL